LDSQGISWFQNKTQQEAVYRHASSRTNRDTGEDMTAGKVVTAIITMVDLYVFWEATISTAAKTPTFSHTEYDIT